MALTTNLVSYWKFDNSGADAVGANTATVTNASYVTGKINQGVSMDGSTSTIQIGTSNLVATTAGQAISFNLWVNSNTASTALAYKQTYNLKDGFGWVWSWGDGSFYGTARFRDSGGTYYTNTSTNISTGTLHMLTGIYDGTNLVTYVDGASTGTNNIGSLVRYSAGTGNYIGNNSSGSDMFNGIVDEAGLWSRALTSAEVTQLYNGGAGLPYPLVPNTGKSNFFALM